MIFVRVEETLDEVRIAWPEGRGRRKRGKEGGAGIKARGALRVETGHRGRERERGFKPLD